MFNPVDFFIRNLHSLTKLYTRTSTGFSKNLVHAALYGDGNVSEAIASGVRLNNLDHERIALKPGMTCGYIVVRPKNPDVAYHAGKIAESLSRTPEEDAAYSYSVPKGIRGSLSNSKLERQGLESYLKATAYGLDSFNIPMEGSNRKKFYCSHFVTWCLQAAEGVKVLNEINESLSELSQIKPPNTEGLSNAKAGKVIKKWAQETAKSHHHLLKHYINLDLDPGKVTPQSLFGFVLEHPELFECKMVITPPKNRERTYLS